MEKQLHLWVASHFGDVVILREMMSPFPKLLSTHTVQCVEAAVHFLVRYSQHTMGGPVAVLTHVKSIPVSVSIGSNWVAGFVHVDV